MANTSGKPGQIYEYHPYYADQYREAHEHALERMRQFSYNQAFYASAANPILGTPAAEVPTEPLPQESHLCATGGITGWRKWCVGLFDNRIKSIRGTVWEPYKKLEAKCEKQTCSGAGCECGIYTFKEQSKIEAFDPLKNIKGETYMWGRVLQCELGYRAQFAYPKNFVNTGILAEAMAEVYGVKLIDDMTSTAVPS